VKEVVKETVSVLASPVNGTDCRIVPTVNLMEGYGVREWGLRDSEPGVDGLGLMV
jgi:hypothetical protein